MNKPVAATVEMAVRVVEEQREDRWAFTSDQFGFTVYGDTRDAAYKAFDEALTTLMNSFSGDDPLLREFLDRKSVQHRLVQVDQITHRSFERQFEVQLGAPK